MPIYLFKLHDFFVLQNDSLLTNIYNFKWEYLSIREQKYYLFLLVNAQQYPYIPIGPFAVLNVDSGLKIMKTIYSVFMLMFKFVGTLQLDPV